MSRLRRLLEFGQSFWLDYIRRSLITQGELNHLIENDGLRGVTSNPSIFQKAIAGSSDYDPVIETYITNHPHLEAPARFEKLSIEDIQL